MGSANTFVLVAPDCPVEEGIVPASRSGTQTVAELQYQLLSQHPYRYTLEDLILEVHLQRLGLSASERATCEAAIRAELFSKPQACMRASPLPKSYGFGVHYDSQGRLAIFSKGSTEYQHLASSPELRIVKAMRSRRA